MSPNQTVSSYWSRWMLYVTAQFIIYGAFMLITNEYFLRIFIRIFPDLLYQQAIAGSRIFDFARWGVGISGAWIVGMNIILFFVIYGPFQKGEPWAWTAIASSVLAKTLLNAWAAWAQGFWIDLGGQAIYLIVYALPLALTYRAFFPQSPPKPASK